MSIVGRESELDLLAGLIDREHAGPSAIAILGSPGIGKTEVWREAVRLAKAGGCTVLSSSAVETEATLSFTGLGDLLEDHLDGVLPTLPGPQRHALEVALLRADQDRPVEPRAVSIGFLNVLRLMASKSPVVIAVDDVQWLDIASLRATEFALRRLGSVPVITLVTRRGESASDEIPLMRAIPRQKTRTLHLGSLSLGATQRLLHDRLGGDLHRYTVLRVHEASGGNPMLALEMAALVLQTRSQPKPGQSLPVPRNIHDLLVRRLDGLDERTRRLLITAACLAAPTIGLLTRAAPTSAHTALEEATRAGLVVCDDERIQFTHPLLRSVLRESLRDEQRRRLHARLATIVTESEERARHLALSVRSADERVAMELESGATGALARGAAIAAGELFEQAAALTPSSDSDRIGNRRLSAALAYFNAGDVRRSRFLLDELLRWLPAGRLRARVLLQLGLVRSFSEDVAGGVELLERAVAESAEHPRERVGALTHLAMGKASLLRLDEVTRHLEEALALASATGDETGATEVAGQLAFWRFITGDEPFTEMLKAAQHSARTDPAVRLTFGPDYWAAHILKCTDDLGGAWSLVESLRRVGHDRGDEESLLSIDLSAAEIELGLGRWQSALQFATESAEIAESYGFVSNSALAYAMRALIEAHLGLVDEMRTSVSKSESAAARTGFLSGHLYIRWALGLTALVNADPAGADEQLGGLAAMTVAAGIVEPGAMPWLMDAAEALVELGRHGEAENIIAAYLDAAERRKRAWCIAAGLRCRALVELARKDVAAALADAGRALEMAETGSRSFEIARCLLVIGIVERRAGQRADAARHLRRAGELFRAVGARGWIERSSEELRRADPRANAMHHLSATESRVAGMASSGKSNPEIAAALYMSRKTVEANLARAYRKLGIQSRMELARALGTFGSKT